MGFACRNVEERDIGGRREREEEREEERKMLRAKLRQKSRIERTIWMQ